MINVHFIVNLIITEMGMCLESVIGDNKTLETIDDPLLRKKFEELGQGHVFSDWETLYDADR